MHFREQPSHNPDLVFGLHAVEAVIESGNPVNKVMIARDERSQALAALFSKCRDKGVLVQFVPKEKLNRLTRGNHQGVIALTAPVAYQSLEDLVTNWKKSGKPIAIAALDGVTDVRNLGAIGRTAYCCGLDALLIPEAGSSSITSDAVKTSAGALMDLPVCRTKNLRNSVLWLQEQGIRIISVTEHATEEIQKANLGGDVCFIFGAEDEGISKQIRSISDIEVRIPMANNPVGSFNVGIAAGMAFFSWMNFSK